MLGHFTELPAAGIEPVGPDAPEPEEAEDDELVVGVVVAEFVAAWAAIPPPNTSAPVTATPAIALLIPRMSPPSGSWSVASTTAVKRPALGAPWEFGKRR